MIISGQFKDLFDNLYTVEIENESVSSADIEIGKEWKGYDDAGEVYFTSDPVTIEAEMDDLFTVVGMSSAKINVYTKHFIGDKLFANNDRSVTVKIYKGDTRIFDGFVEPGTFNQPFTSPYDEFTINCIDKLSTLQYHKYKDITPNNFETVKATLGNTSFKAVIMNALSELIDNEGHVYYDLSKGLVEGREGLIFEDLMIDENVFVGDDYDACMTYEQALEETLRYLNLHIKQVGYDFYIFDWDTITNGKDNWVDITNNIQYTLEAENVSLTASNNASTDTSISVDEVYNQIRLTCEMDSNSTIFDSPLSGDKVLSDYSNRQKYMTEYISEGEGVKAINAFKAMIKGETSNYDACKKVDWYLQKIRNKNWKFNSVSGDVNTLTEFDTNGVAINQYKESRRLRDNAIEPALLSLGKVEYEGGRITDDSKITKISMSNYLVISTNGNGKDKDDERVPTATTIKTRQPIVEYLGNTSGVFSPTDDKTTNYLLFSGTMCLIPIQKQTDTYSNLKRVAFEQDNYYFDENNEQVIISGCFTSKYWHQTIPSDNNEDGRYYTRKFYNTKYVNDDPLSATTSDTGYHPLTEDKSNHLYEYSYSSKGDNWDRIPNVDILECELIIGNKRLIQRDGNELSSLEWVKIGQEPIITGDGGANYKLTTFRLGINPKIGDKIIGDEYSITSNFDFTANIDGEGFAIPIKKSDGLSGKVIFRILGPVNQSWNEVYKRTHREWIFFNCSHWSDKTHYLLSNCESITIKDFKCEFKSDNSGVNTDYVESDKDLIYISAENENYINYYDGTTFKLITQPTTQECISLGVSTEMNNNAVLSVSTGSPIGSIYNSLTSETAKAEQHFVDHYYNHYNAPKLLLETCVWDNENITPFNTYYYSSLNRTFFARSLNRSLVDNKVTLTLVEQ